VAFELVKIEKLSGSRTTIYTIYLQDEDETLFDRFIRENLEAFPEELANIRYQLETIAHQTGAIEPFFEKPEGKPGQDVWDLRDKPNKRLRLYCMRISNVVLILGGGGPKTTRTIQEDPKLKAENYLIRNVSDLITEKIKNKEIRWSKDGTELIGETEL
jgi:hypothetical protein